MSISIGLPEHGYSLEDFYKCFLEDKRGKFTFRNSVSGFGSVEQVGNFVSYGRDSKMSLSGLDFTRQNGYSWKSRPINGNVEEVHRHGDRLLVRYGVPERSIAQMRGLAHDMRFYVEPNHFVEGYIDLYLFDPSRCPVEKLAVVSTSRAQIDAGNPIPAIRLLDAYWRRNPMTSWLWSVSGPDGI